MHINEPTNKRLRKNELKVKYVHFFTLLAATSNLKQCCRAVVEGCRHLLFIWINQCKAWQMCQLAKCDTTELMFDFDAWKYKHGVKSLLPVHWLCFELNDLLSKTLKIPVLTGFEYQSAWYESVIHRIVRLEPCICRRYAAGGAVVS